REHSLSILARADGAAAAAAAHAPAAPARADRAAGGRRPGPGHAPLSAELPPLRRLGGESRAGRRLSGPSCRRGAACEAIRVEVARFAPSRTQRRIWRRGEALVQTEIGTPETTAAKVALHQTHK